MIDIVAIGNKYADDNDDDGDSRPTGGFIPNGGAKYKGVAIVD